jgi:hypothetical protein
MIFYLPESVCFGYTEFFPACSAPIMSKPVTNASTEEVLSSARILFATTNVWVPHVPAFGTWDFTDVAVAVTERLFLFKECPVTDIEILTQPHVPKQGHGAPTNNLTIL